MAGGLSARVNLVCFFGKKSGCGLLFYCRRGGFDKLVAWTWV